MREINLTNFVFKALVDAEDYEKVNQYKWFIHGRYVETRVAPKNTIAFCLHLHKLVTGCKWIDHIDGNGLNNQKANLRKTNFKLNGANRKLDKDNSTGYKGISYKRGKYEAQIGVDMKTLYLGRFVTKKEAALAYNTAAIKYFGEYARLNVI